MRNLIRKVFHHRFRDNRERVTDPAQVSSEPMCLLKC